MKKVKEKPVNLCVKNVIMYALRNSTTNNIVILRNIKSKLSTNPQPKIMKTVHFVAKIVKNNMLTAVDYGGIKRNVLLLIIIAHPLLKDY